MVHIKIDCPLCGCKARQLGEDPTTDVSCPNCGEFAITFEAATNMNNHFKLQKEWAKQAPLLSYIIRKAYDKGKKLTLTMEFFDSIIKNETLPTVSEQADRLVIWLGKNQKDPGKTIEINPEIFRARIGAKSNRGVLYILENLDNDLIEKEREELRESDAVYDSWQLTFAGWNRFEELKRKGIETNRAFMAMQYDSIKDVPEGYAISEPEWSKMFDIFKAEVKKTGFILYLLKDKPEAGLIDDRMLVEIRNSKFTVADLTFGNQGAYWESGFAEGLEKKVIYTCEKKWFDDKKTHFDTNHRQTIIWERGNVQEAAEKLKATIRNSFPVDAKMTDD
jgi:hypothetical protein